ncbi:hypothetical protein ACIRP0_23055 [Streptomyces sp. NPDC101733]|uniref:hypothetical protein n=1 Tax=unclassified Streptomyces TaxID=2593676 RepID=UPI0037FFC671
MTDSVAHPISSYYVTIRGERFTCGEITGLGPQGDLGLPGQELTLTLDDCVLTDVPKAEEWALSAEGPSIPENLKIEEVVPGEATPRTTWYLHDVRPDGMTDHSTTASNHETRIGSLTVHATKISPSLDTGA